MFEIAFLVFCLFGTVDSFHIIDLSSKDWLLENHDLNISVPIETPGSVHTCLLGHGYINDPYKPFNDEKYAWIADKQWVFRTNFSVDSPNALTKKVLLKFDVIDTVCDIILNKKLLGQTNNMFVQYSFDITDILQTENELVMQFYSPTQYAKQHYTNYLKSFNYKVPPIELPEVQHGRNHQNFIRKEQCSFSWDWGPSFPTIGLNGDVQVEFINFVNINHIMVHTTYNEDTDDWELYLEVISESAVSANATIIYGFDGFEKRQLVNIIQGTNEIALTPVQVASKFVTKWWPKGYGVQKLYTAFVQIINENSEEYTSSHVTFGFRTVKLIQDVVEGGDKGREFYFEFNGRPIFLKGANWIPADAFQERVSFSVLEGLLNDTVEANMNALRVWGGGIYEQDEFYNIADKLGIVIWQDLMFAVALYPVNEEFLESVQQEIKYQVRRLQHHPSVIVWSGNNENEAAIAQAWWDEVETYKDQLSKDYRKLYVETIKPIVEKEDWNRPFIVSSPSNGLKSEEEGYLSNDPQNELYGDVHYYNYTGDCWVASTFPNPRFASEYGYQSYPSYITWLKVANEKELIWNNSLMFNRQHHALGNQEIEDFIKQHFTLPNSSEKSRIYFKDMVYLSQIVQATCIKYESEHYRRLQGNFIGKYGNTMGALYWQLNDIWQAPSWSSIEYGRRWKMLHYYVKNFFSPKAISGHVIADTLEVFVLLDRPELQRFFEVKIKVYTWSSFKAHYEKSVDVDVTKEATPVFNEKIEDLCTFPACLVKLELVDSHANDVISTSDVFIGSFKNIQLPNPELKVKSISKVSSGYFRVDLQAKLPAAFVWLETTYDGHFTDNGFIMSDPYVSVYFKSTYQISLVQFQENLTVQSLYDVYHR